MKLAIAKRGQLTADRTDDASDGKNRATGFTYPKCNKKLVYPPAQSYTMSEKFSRLKAESLIKKLQVPLSPH